MQNQDGRNKTHAPEGDSRMINEQAAHWFALQLDAGLSKAEQAEFEQWQQNPRHARAYRQMQQLWQDSAEVLGADASQADMREPVRHGTQRKLRAVLAVAACLLVMVFGVNVWHAAQPAVDYRTAVGEQQRVQLPDGSQAELGPDTRLALHFSDSERVLEVLSGSAWFDVAPDASRPFRVRARGGDSTALGTAFAVNLRQGGAEIVVTEHRVAVSHGAQQRTLSAGQAVQYRDGQMFGPEQVDTAMKLAWRDQQLVFISQPLGDVLKEIERWHPGRLVLVSRSLAERPVTLIVDTRRVDDMLGKLTQALPLQTMSLGSHVTFLYEKRL